MKNQVTKQNQSTKNAALYIRSNHVDGLPSQVILGTQYATTKGYNVPISQIYTDVCSANAKERPGFTKLMRESRKKKINTVIVTGTDRLARTPEQLFMMNLQMMFQNINLQVVN